MFCPMVLITKEPSIHLKQRSLTTSTLLEGQNEQKHKGGSAGDR